MPSLPSEVAAIPWYHTIELPGGVVTPGFYDHRRLLARLPIPDTLEGKRCLDVGSSDGFWAFELARRGAAEVVSVDLEDPSRQEWQGVTDDVEERRSQALQTSGRWEADRGRTRRAFELAREALELDVRRLDLSAYDLSPDAVGQFDFVFMGSLLLHLRDPVRALCAVRSVLRGELLSLEPVAVTLSLLHPRAPAALLWELDEPRWWTANVAGLRRLTEAAGLGPAAAGGLVFQRFGRGFSGRPRLRRPSLAEAGFWLFIRPLGAPSSWVLARA